MLIPKIFPVTCHTDHVGPGTTFVAIKGFKFDATKYIPLALEKGATTIVLDKRAYDSTLEALCHTKGATYLLVENTRKALAQLASEKLNHPSKKLKIIGLTGTKGKSTTTYIIQHILGLAGKKTALIGGITNNILHKSQGQSRLTTPDSDYLHVFFDQCVKASVEYVVMEVSSHALSLDRVFGIAFEAIGFTNLTSEHMDFYHSMDDYFSAKAKLFEMVRPGGSIVINTDDAWGKKATKLCQQTNSIHHIKQKNFTPLILRLSKDISANLFGTFNAYNATMASIICQSLGISQETIRDALKTFPGVPGRLQKHVLKNGASAFVDFAHNSSGMEAVLKALRPYTNDLIVVFGCGGDRDKTKRPVMGGLAAQFADKIIITDDNPRSEDRNQIINDILIGIPEEKRRMVIREPDRGKAVSLAASLATPESIIALLGKGHETHYLINNQMFRFDDFEEVSKF